MPALTLVEPPEEGLCQHSSSTPAFGATRGLHLVLVGGVALSRRPALEAALELLERRLVQRYAVLAEHLVVALVMQEVAVDLGKLGAALAQLAIASVLVTLLILLIDFLMMPKPGVDSACASFQYLTWGMRASARLFVGLFN